MVFLLTLLRLLYYRARMVWAERDDVYVREQWLLERRRARELD